MDTNAGRFVEEASAEDWMQRISVNEIIKLKGEDCRVVRIGERQVVLELMSATDRIGVESEALASILEERASLLNRHERRAAEAKKRKSPQ